MENYNKVNMRSEATKDNHCPPLFASWSSSSMCNTVTIYIVTCLHVYIHIYIRIPSSSPPAIKRHLIQSSTPELYKITPMSKCKQSAFHLTRRTHYYLMARKLRQSEFFVCGYNISILSFRVFSSWFRIHVDKKNT